jgi:uncharacterized damage-inducible protein DinB
MNRTKWFERKFPAIEDNGLLPSIIERLAGTPARIEEIVSNINSEMLQLKLENKWSIKEEVEHLGDLEPLWLQRLNDLLNNAAELTKADLSNQTTHNANHNSSDIAILTIRFRYQRKNFVDKLRKLTNEQLLNTALHPRLKTPMRIIDLAYFVAEHDDHHIAAILEILQA